MAEQRQAALSDGIRAHILTGIAGQLAAEGIRADERAGDLVGELRVGVAIDLGLWISGDGDGELGDGQVIADVGQGVVAAQSARVP